jgi:IS30 family transposase
MDDCTAHSVRNVFIHLRHLLGCEYGRLFPLILTDNGSEFSDPRAIEVDEEGEFLSRIFYCDPKQSQQKGAAEVNHEMIRRIIPKGVSMDRYCQQHICLMMNHINSYGRSVLNEHAPFHIFELIFGTDIAKKLGAELVQADKIILRPALLK